MPVRAGGWRLAYLSQPQPVMSEIRTGKQLLRFSSIRTMELDEGNEQISDVMQTCHGYL